jgi:hypothetical protein
MSYSLGKLAFHPVEQIAVQRLQVTFASTLADLANPLQQRISKLMHDEL